MANTAKRKRKKGIHPAVKIGGGILLLGGVGYLVYKALEKPDSPAITPTIPTGTTTPTAPTTKTTTAGITLYVADTPQTRAFGGAKLRKDYKNADDFIKENIGSPAGETTGKVFVQDGISFVEVKRGFWGTKYYIAQDFVTDRQEAPKTNDGSFNALWYANKLYELANQNYGMTEDEEGMVELAKSICKSKWQSVVSAYQSQYGQNLDAKISDWISDKTQRAQFYANMPTNC